jgi:hypothetical protein
MIQYTYTIQNPNTGFLIVAEDADTITDLFNYEFYRKVGLKEFISKRRIYDIYLKRVKIPKYLEDYKFIRVRKDL